MPRRLFTMSDAASLAIHTMVLMARQPEARFSTQQIAGELQASGHHLSKILQRLVRAGLLSSTRGPLGGFQLTSPARKVTLLAIYVAMEGPCAEHGCLLSKPMCDGRGCMLGDFACDIHDQFYNFLYKTTLARLAENSHLAKPAPNGAAARDGCRKKAAAKPRRP